MPVVAAFGEIFLEKIPKLTALLAVALSIYLSISSHRRRSIIRRKPFRILIYARAAISFSISFIITKPLFDIYSDVTVSFYQSLFGCLAFIPFWGLKR